MGRCLSNAVRIGVPCTGPAIELHRGHIKGRRRHHNSRFRHTGARDRCSCRIPGHLSIARRQHAGLQQQPLFPDKDGRTRRDISNRCARRQHADTNNSYYKRKKNEMYSHFSPLVYWQLSSARYKRIPPPARRFTPVCGGRSYTARERSPQDRSRTSRR